MAKIRRKKESSIAGGSSYKAKKAGGDMKKSGQHDPYSYLPLRKDMLNKRYAYLFVGEIY